MAPPPRGAALAYRREIDGLRALSVVAVMLYHGGFSRFSGGFVGVDVFFVISGYLITGLMLRELDRGEFRWAGFMERRARRLVPALAVVLAACVPVAWVFLPPAHLQGFSTSLAATAASVANLYFWRAPGGYFADHVALLPLVHMWSLSLEEQFYLLFPPVMLLIWRYGRRHILWWLAGGCVASLALAALGSAIAPAATFYLLPMRGWELLAGGLLAEHERRSGPAGVTLATNVTAVVGLGAILGPVLFLNGTHSFPWPHAVPVVAGSVLVLRCAVRGSWVAALLSTRPLVGCGLVSYSAYLWHQPLLAFARNIWPYALATTATLALLLLSMVLAGVTWRFVERPWRRRRGGAAYRWVIPTMLVLGLLAGIGAVGTVMRGAPQRFSPYLLYLATLKEAHAKAVLPCMMPLDVTDLPERPCVRGTSGPVTVALIGDSHAAAMMPGVTEWAQRNNRRVLELTHAGCPAVIDPAAVRPFQAPCIPFNRAVFQRIANEPRISTVVISTRWTYNLLRTLTDNGEGGVEESVVEPSATAQERGRTAKAYQDFVHAYLNAGKRVVLIYPDVEAGWEVPMMIFRASRLGDPDIDTSVSYKWVRERNAAAVRALDAVRHHRVSRVYPERALCGHLRSDRCITRIGNRPLFYDDDHVLPETSKLIMRHADPLID